MFKSIDCNMVHALSIYIWAYLHTSLLGIAYFAGKGTQVEKMYHNGPTYPEGDHATLQDMYRVRHKN